MEMGLDSLATTQLHALAASSVQGAPANRFMAVLRETGEALVRLEREEAHTELRTALTNLGVVTEENVSLTEQIAKLLEEFSDVNKARKERDVHTP